MERVFNHILVIRLSAMGDVAMTVPVLKAFTKKYTEVKVTVLTKAIYAPFFMQLPVEVKIVEVKGKHKGLFGLLRLFNELKKTKIDAVADLHDVMRSNVLKRYFKLIKIPFEQIDKGREEKKALTHLKNKIFEPLQSTHERYADVFRKLGFELELSKNDVLGKEKLDTITSNLVGVDTKKWIGFAPFAKHVAKEYPLERSLQVIEELSKKQYKVLLFGGGQKETNLLKNIAQKLDNVICVANELNMRQELDLISNLDAMIAMDSGNGHIGAMFGIPVVTVWGVTHPYVGFTPFGQPEENSILPDLVTYDLIPTSVYGNKYPDGYENVMKSILPEQIIDRVIEITNQTT